MDTTTNTPLPEEQNPVSLSAQHGSGSIGPFFVVMSVIIVLSALSCILGRYCGSRAEGPDSWYDCLAWCKRRCGRRVCGGWQKDLDPKARDDKQLAVPPSNQP